MNVGSLSASFDSPAPLVVASTNWGAFANGVFDVTQEHVASHASPRLCESRISSQYALSNIAEPTMRIRRKQSSTSPARADAVAVHLIGADRLEGRMGPRALAARRGDLVFYDLQETVDLRLERTTSAAPDLMLWLPRARLPKTLADFETLHGLTVRGDIPVGALVSAAVTALAAQGPRAADREFDAMAEGVLALIAAAILPSLEAARGGPPPLASFTTIRRYIDKNVQAPGLNADSLAKTFGLSRASLYRLFEPAGGVAGYIRAARLRRAHSDIVDAEFADRRIGPIAYGLGFKNVSAFNRLFRQEFGASPRELRAGRAPSERGANASPGEEGEFTLLHWLRKIGASGVEFIAENSRGAGVRLRKPGPAAISVDDVNASNDE